MMSSQKNKISGIPPTKSNTLEWADITITHSISKVPIPFYSPSANYLIKKFNLPQEIKKVPKRSRIVKNTKFDYPIVENTPFVKQMEKLVPIFNDVFVGKSFPAARPVGVCSYAHIARIWHRPGDGIVLDPIIVPKPVKPVYCNFNNGYLWDIRNLFKITVPKRSKIVKNNNPALPILGYINQAPVYGPITKSRHYARIQFLRAQRIERCAAARAARDAAALNAKIRQRGLIRIGDVLVSIKIAAIPLFNVPKVQHKLARSTSVKQVKVPRRFIQSSLMSESSYVPVGISAKRDLNLVSILRNKIRNMRIPQDYAYNHEKLAARDIAKVKNILNQARLVQPQGPTINIVENERLRCKTHNCPYLQRMVVEVEQVICPLKWCCGEDYDYHGTSIPVSKLAAAMATCTKEAPRRSVWTMMKSRLANIIRYWMPPALVEEGVEMDEIVVFAQPQMDTEGKSVQDVTVSHDVTVVEQRDASEHVEPIIMGPSWTQLASTDELRTLPSLCERETLGAVKSWSSNSTIEEIELPGAMLNLMTSAPLNLMFTQHKYFRGDMRITVHINTNKFMWGQLMVAFYYCDDPDSTFNDRKNIYSISQMRHVLVQAGSSNTAELVIPFRHYNPLVSIAQRDSDDVSRDIGCLIIAPMNKLTCTTNTYNSVNYSITMQLENTLFTGLVDTGLVTAQMDWLAAFAIERASAYLINSFADRNRDNPPVDNVPQPVQIIQAGNLSHGTGVVEPLTSLRLVPSGQTPHYNLPRDEMRVDHVTRVFGLVNILSWGWSDDSAKCLEILHMDPLWDIGDYPRVVVGENTFHVVPPVGVISSMFAYWRGSLEFRFDIVANAFYTGSLLVAYIPGVVSPVSMMQARSSHHMIFSLQEEKSFTFTTPYIADAPWWHRRYSPTVPNQTRKAPASLQIFVLNKLIPMDNVPTSIEINVYVRGGPDFEVSCPVQPCLSSSVHSFYDPTPGSNVIYALPGYSPYYAGTSRYFRNDTKALFRYSSFDDHVSCFETLDLKKYYRLTSADTNKYRLRRKNDDGSWSTYAAGIYCNYAVPIKDSNNNYWLAPVQSESYALQFVKTQNDEWLYSYPNDDSDENDGGWANPGWEPVTPVADWEVLTPEGEELNTHGVSVTGDTLASTSGGLYTFGERFDSLTTLMRRYQYYGRFEVTQSVPFVLLLRPNGCLSIKDTKNGTLNRWREGLCGLIASGYRFFRGGMRVKLVIRGDARGVLIVQHHPEEHGNAVFKGDAQICQGYATYIQDMTVNPIMTVEIPFYLPTVFGLLDYGSRNGVKQVDNIVDLGRLYIYSQGNSKITLDAFTALADDARFECFQGFPPMRLLVPTLNADPQGDVEADGGVLTTLKETKETLDVVNSERENITKLSGAIGKANSLWDTLKENLKFTKYISYQVFINVFTQMFHIASHPNSGATLFISIASIIISCLGCGMEYLGGLTEALSKFWGLFSGEQKEKVTPNMDVADDSANVLVGTLASIVGALVCAKTSLPGHALASVVKLFTTTSAISRGVEGIIKLFKMIMIAMSKLVDYFFIYNEEVPDVRLLLKDNGDELINWSLHVEQLLDPRSEEHTLMSDQYVDEVFLAYLHSCVYCAQLGACTGTTQALNYISKLSERLRELKSRLLQLGKHPYSRPTPFSIWLDGQPGIGKSDMQDRIIGALLKKIQYKERRNVKYTLVPQNDHWETCNGEPAFVVDDAFAVTEPSALVKQLSVYFNLVSSAPYNPPMAALEKKHMRVAPLLLVSCANKAYPELTGVGDITALYRRRHALVRVHVLKEIIRADGKKVPVFVGNNLNLEAFTDEEKKDFAWLRFGFYDNPRVKQDANTVVANMVFKDFLTHIEEQFLKHYTREVERCKARVDELYAYLNEGVNELTKPEEVVAKAKKSLAGATKEVLSDVVNFIRDNGTSWKSRFKTDLKISVPPVRPLQGKVAPQFFNDEDEHLIAKEDWQEWLKIKSDFETFASGVFKPMTEEHHWLPPDGELFKTHEEWFKKYYEKPELCPTEQYFEAVATPDEVKAVGWVLNPKNTIDDCKIKCVQALYDRYYKRLHKTHHKATSVCRHGKLCACYTLLRIKDVEFAVPDYTTCAECKERKAKPEVLKFCGEKCCLLYPNFHPPRTFKSKVYEKACVVQRFLWKAMRKCFSAGVGFLKKACKVLLQGARWTLRKIIKAVINYIVPTCAVFAGFVGISYLKDSLKDKSFKERIVRYGDVMIKRPYQSAFETFTTQAFPSEDQGPYDGAGNTRGTGRLNTSRMTAKVLSQGSDSVVGSDYLSDVKDLVARNTFILKVTGRRDDGEAITMSTYCVFLRARTALMVKHCWDELEYMAIHNGNSQIELVKSNDCKYRISLPLTSLEFKRYEQSNLGLLTFPAQVPMMRDIVRNIPRLRDHRRVTNRGWLLTINNELVEMRKVNVQFQETPLCVRGTNHSDEVTFVGAYKYNFGGPGYCGSILLSEDLNPCIIGMHVAGVGSSIGYSEPLIAESFGIKFDDNRELVDIATIPLQPLDQSKMDVEAELFKLGCVPPQFGHHESGKSKIVPSLVHGIFPIQTGPAPLACGDPRLPEGCSPMREGVKKLGEPVVVFPKHLLAFARDSLKQELRVKVQPIIGVEPVPLQEAITGRCGVKGFSPINFHTSEGFPFATFRPAGYSDKRWLFDLEMTQKGYFCKGIHKYLVDIMTAKNNLRQRGIMPVTIFTDCLKDARIPVEKLSIPGKTRVFSISPIDYTIVFRQYFLPYLVAHQQNRRNFSSGVGMNVKGPEWTDLVIQMLSHSENHLCGDYSNFGANFSAQVHEIVGEGILDWFNFNGAAEANNRIRRVLLSELVNSYHLVFNMVYQTFGGMPSGSPITVETNDLVNLCYILMAWHEIMSDSDYPEYSSYYHFTRFVCIKTYGDDLWLSVKDKVLPFFNNITIRDFFKKYGVKYTDASKSGDMVASKSIFEVDFLKCRPIPHPTRDFDWLSQLNINSCLDIANWCWSSKDLVAATIVNLEACSDSLYGHGPEVHEKYRQILVSAANRLGATGNFRSWNELDKLFFPSYNIVRIYPTNDENNSASKRYPDTKM